MVLFCKCTAQAIHMSEDTDVYIYGDTTRRLWDLFSSKANGLKVLNIADIRPVLNEIALFPTKAQLHELVHWACESSGRTPLDHIVFGEFCILVTELQEHYRKSPPVPQPRSQLNSQQCLEERRRKRRPTDIPDFQVFLGGSCNPTTWRLDRAIPYLKNQNISFYNPQVIDWKPELMELEYQAKESAELLFFVIDNKTRSTASMVEAAFLAGLGRQLILVIKDFSPEAEIAGEIISHLEYEDLERSHAYLTDLVERQGIPVFGEIEIALDCTNKAIKDKLRVSDLTLNDRVQPVRYPHVRVADKFMRLKDIFESMDVTKAGSLPFKDVNLSFRTITDENLPANNDLSKHKAYKFDEFCCIVAEYRYKKRTFFQKLFWELYNFPIRAIDWLRGRTVVPERYVENEPRQNDVFLGGTCGKSTWRTKIAIPELMKHGISYYNPQLPEWSTHYIPLEAAIKDKCRVLLYVITNDTRAITSMLEAGHYLGQNCNVVLCIQNLPEGVIIQNEQLTSLSVKDYNRARSYLADLANRRRVPIFEKVEEAIHCVVQKIKFPHRDTRSSSLT